MMTNALKNVVKPPRKCPPQAECKEPRFIKIEGNDCDCVCPDGSIQALGSDGEITCCKGANKANKDGSTSEIDQTCCEQNASGVYVAGGGTMGAQAACCKSATSSKDIDGTLNSSCCKNAGGGLRNGKCCHQQQHGS